MGDKIVKREKIKEKEGGRFQDMVDRLDRLFRWFRLRYTRSLRVLNRIRLPGFKGAGVFDVFNFLFSALGNRHFTLYGAAMAFQFFFAVFPGMIFLFTLIPRIPIRGMQDQIQHSLQAIVPAEGLALVNNIVNEVFNGKSVGLLSINLFLTLYASLNGIRAMMFAFSKKDTDHFHPRSFLWSYILAFLIFIILLLLLIMSLIFSVMSDRLFDYIGAHNIMTEPTAAFFGNALETILVLSVLFAGISIVFFLAPETKTRWSFISPGSILTGVLFLAAVWIFKTIFIEFVNYNKFYGSLSGVMLLMFWFYWISLVFLIGFELNAAIDKANANRKRTGKFHLGDASGIV